MLRYLLPVMRVVTLRGYTGPDPWPGLTDPNDVPIWQTAVVAGALRREPERPRLSALCRGAPRLRRRGVPHGHRVHRGRARPKRRSRARRSLAGRLPSTQRPDTLIIARQGREGITVQPGDFASGLARSRFAPDSVGADVRPRPASRSTLQLLKRERLVRGLDRCTSRRGVSRGSAPEGPSRPGVLVRLSA